ncbi:MAG: hypothetical protein M3Y78_03680 [Pseudomonadota bacterium]|nr:hypothetical protein [Pseudomonadota bacterium]
MRTVSAHFDTYDEVAAAVDGLADMGVPSSEIAVVSPRRGAKVKITEAAALGGAVGGIAGLLAGLGMSGIPGLAPVFGIGWLLPFLIGAAAGSVAGGVIGSLTHAGIGGSEARVHAEGVRRGGTLVVARVHDDEARCANAVLLRCGAIDTNSRRSEYAADGWESFVARDIWDEDIGSEDMPPGDESKRKSGQVETGRDKTNRRRFA